MRSLVPRERKSSSLAKYSAASAAAGTSIMPPIGMLMGNVDFTNLFINLSDTKYVSLAAAEEAGAAVIRYGTFINSVLDFVIVAFAIFMVIKGMNSMKKAEEAAPPPAPPEPSAEEKLLTEIRDALKR